MIYAKIYRVFTKAPEQSKSINDKLDLLIECQQESEHNDEQLARLVAEVRRVVGVLEYGQGGGL